MPRGTLDDKYLTWLYGQIADAKIRRGNKTYWKLLRQLYSHEFQYFIPNDSNRASDGRDLRLLFADENACDIDAAWMDLDCSFLEMLVAFAKRLEFQSEQTSERWFWELLQNLGISEYHDDMGYNEKFVDECVARVNERTYHANGSGGLFPLRKPKKDQRRVELWYQMCEYLLQDM